MTKVNQVTMNANGKMYDLNGYLISNKGNVVYDGVFYDEERGYTAFINQTKEEQEISGRKRTFFLSSHYNILDAAATIKQFNDNRKLNIERLTNVTNGAWRGRKVSHKYLPITDVEHKKVLKNLKNHKVVNYDHLPADANWNVIVDLVTPQGIKEMVAYYGKETLLQARKFLTIGETKARFGL